MQWKRIICGSKNISAGYKLRRIKESITGTIMHIPCGLVCAFLSAAVVFAYPQDSIAERISIEKVSSIRIEAGKREYSFLSIADIKTDENGFIYVLDSKKQLVQVYDKEFNFVRFIGEPAFTSNSEEEFLENVKEMAAGKSSMKKGSLFSPQNLWIHEGKIYVSDIDKISIYTLDGGFLKNIRLKSLSPRAIFVNNAEEIVIACNSEESTKVFSVISGDGDVLRSFGDYFNVPEAIKARLESRKGQISEKDLSFPIAIHYVSTTRTLFCLDPFRYEIRMYEEEKLVGTMDPDAPDCPFYPPQAVSEPPESGRTPWSVAYVSPPRMLWLGDCLLVFLIQNDFANRISGFDVDLFKKARKIASSSFGLSVYPLHIAEYSERSGGDLYCIEFEQGNMTVGKYHIRIIDSP